MGAGELQNNHGSRALSEWLEPANAGPQPCVFYPEHPLHGDTQRVEQNRIKIYKYINRRAGEMAERESNEARPSSVTDSLHQGSTLEGYTTSRKSAPIRGASVELVGDIVFTFKPQHSG